MSWKYDAPTGTYRDFALSSNIRREAIADVQFMKFFRAENGYGKGKGQSVTITRIMKLPEATRITEEELLPTGRPNIETKTVGTSEWGFAIPVTEFEKNLTHFDIMNPFQAALRDQISLTMDTMCADALHLTPIGYTPLTTGGEFVTDGVADSVSDRNLGVQDLRRIYDELQGTLKAPKFRNGQYIGILSTRAARGLKNDPDYKDWLAPTTAQPFLTGQLKDIEGFSLYETNHVEALADLLGTSTVTGDAIFFGADAGGLVTVMDPEIRAGIPEDLGRYRKVGWVATVDAFLVWERATQARAVKIVSL